MMAVPIYFANMILDTNFMFLMSADEGNPLLLFENVFGNHLIGYPFIILGVIIVMYVPVILFKRITKNKKPL